MKKLILTLAAICVIAAPFYFVAADAREQATQDAHENAEANAKYIVEQLIDKATITARRRIRDQEQIQRTETFLHTVGGELLDPDAYMDAWAGDIFIRYADAVTAVYFDLYLELISPAQLAEIAVFYRSDAGQAKLELRRRDTVSMETNEDSIRGGWAVFRPIMFRL